MKIRTVIFDIGGVLTDSDWDVLLMEIAGSRENVDKMVQTMFYGGIWQKLDSGVWNAEQVLSAFLEKGVGIEDEIRSFWKLSGPRLFQCDFSKPLIRDLKSRGLQVLYLSNWSDYYLRTAAKAMDFLPLMDGGVFSFQEHVIKPDPEIYRRILTKYDLNPEECVFLDDSLANIQAAEDFGIHGIHVTDHKTAHEKLYEMLGDGAALA